MNNLHRELAPVSDKAWAQIEQEASRTLKRHLAARRVVDVQGPDGLERAAVGTGYLREIAGPQDGVQGVLREVKALVELRVPFELDRAAIDAAERGALDCDWAPLKEASRKIAFAEDRAIFDGYAAAHRGGLGISDRGVSGFLPVQYSDRRTEIHAKTQTQSLAGVQSASGPGGDPG